MRDSRANGGINFEKSEFALARRYKQATKGCLK